MGGPKRFDILNRGVALPDSTLLVQICKNSRGGSVDLAAAAAARAPVSACSAVLGCAWKGGEVVAQLRGLAYPGALCRAG